LLTPSFFLFASFCLFFLMHSATTDILTLSLHDALPICVGYERIEINNRDIYKIIDIINKQIQTIDYEMDTEKGLLGIAFSIHGRSEEHTSELQSRFELVCRLLLDKKK